MTQQDPIRRFLLNRGWDPNRDYGIDIEQLTRDIVIKSAEMVDGTPFPEATGPLGENTFSGLKVTWQVACHNASKKVRRYWGLEHEHFFPVYTGLIGDSGQPQSWQSTQTNKIEQLPDGTKATRTD